MRKYSNVKAILFDSGHTLNYPRTGNWFIPPNFFRYVDKSKFKLLDSRKIEEVFSKAVQDLLQKRHSVSDVDAELERFSEFYAVIFDGLAYLGVSADAIREIARDSVYNDEKFVFYDDVAEMLPRFTERYVLGVVSDTWPSLDRVFTNAGLRKHFSTFVMSSMLGVCKPDPLMYYTALSELGIEPYEALFVDDSVKNVEGAKALGLEAVLILRQGKSDYDVGHEYVTSLTELEELLK